MWEWLFVLILAWVLLGGLAAWIAGQKNRPRMEGFLLGSLFGPLGVLVEALLPSLRESERPRVPVAREAESEHLSSAIHEVQRQIRGNQARAIRKEE